MRRVDQLTSKDPNMSISKLWLLGIVVALAMAGCRSYNYTHGDVAFTTKSFLSDINISGLTFEVDPETGLRKVVVESYSADHAAVKALADLAKAGLDAAPTP